MPRRVWVYDPHRGGLKIPPAARERTEQRILAFAEAHYGGKFTRLGIRFRGALCYIDAYLEPAKPSTALLRITKETRQQDYERYSPCSFGNGSWTGTPEQAFEIGSGYLQ